MKNGGAFLGGQGDITWFARKDLLNRPNVKMSTNKVLLLTYLRAEEIPVKTARVLLAGIFGDRDETIIDWNNYVREVLVEKMNNALPMGGPGEVVQIDESYFRVIFQLKNPYLNCRKHQSNNN